MAAPKKKTTKNKTLSADPCTGLTKLEKVNVDQLIAQAFLRYKDEAVLEKKLKVKEMQHLSSIVSEFLNCFVLIGYSLQDEKVIMLNMPSPKDEAALIDLLRSTFLDLASDRP
jgi:hypothetical protein